MGGWGRREECQKASWILIASQSFKLARVQCLPRKMLQIVGRQEEGGLRRARLKVGYNMSDGTLVVCVQRHECVSERE